MNINQITSAIVEAYPSRQPLMTWGPPGGGKSDAYKEAARILNEMMKAGELDKQEGTRQNKEFLAKQEFGFIDLRLGLLDPVDLRGLPYPDPKTKTVQWFTPGFLPTTGRGLLLLDEFVEATHSMQGCASQLVLNRRLGDYKLPDGWMVGAAGNEMSHRASSKGMPKQMENRFVHLTAEVDVNSWLQWAVNKKLDMRVIAFIKFRSALLHVFDPQDKGHAFASPRSWEFVSNMLTKSKANKGTLLALLQGAVGVGPGGEFAAFVDTFAELAGLVDNILLNPKMANLPENPGVLFVLSSTLAERATKDNLPTMVKYFDRLSDTGHPEYAVSAMKAISAKDKGALCSTRTFCEWAARHNHVLS